MLKGHIRLWLGVALTAFIGVSRASAQQPVVFVHGLLATGSTWQTAANRLAQDLLAQGVGITVYLPTLGHGNLYEVQSDHLRSYLTSVGVGNNKILVGHSNGGIVSRELTKTAPAKGIITVATPHRGARLATQVGQLSTIMSTVAAASAYSYFLTDPFNWFGYDVDPRAYDMAYWGAVAGTLFGYAVNRVANNVIGHEAVLSEMTPETAGNYLGALNSATNLAHEAQASPTRRGIAVQALYYYEGGMFTPVVGAGASAANMSEDLAIVGYNLIADAMWLEWEINYGSPYWYLAETAVMSHLYLGYYAVGQRNIWCSMIGAYVNNVCLPSDGVVPTASQFYPGGATELMSGPSHTEVTRDIIVSDKIRGGIVQAMR